MIVTVKRTNWLHEKGKRKKKRKENIRIDNLKVNTKDPESSVRAAH
jgi:hypothetical protein